MNLTLIRHGQTEGNLHHRYIGATDQPLCRQGREGAEKAGRDEGGKTVYVTSLRRTQETAAILFPQARQIVVPELREMDFGVFENRNAQEMEADVQFRDWVEGFCLAPCPGGEGREAFLRRVCGCFRELAQSWMSSQEEDITMVVHGGTIMALLSQFALPKRDYFDWRVKNCKGYRCRLTLEPGGQPRLDQLTPWP